MQIFYQYASKQNKMEKSQPDLTKNANNIPISERLDEAQAEKITATTYDK
jgi:hypothetical protein